MGAMGIRYLELDRTIISGSTLGSAVGAYSEGSAAAQCCDVWNNGGGDWVGPLASQDGVNGNISLDPLFCSTNTPELYLRDESPCAPFTEPNPDCDLIGAWLADCALSDVSPRAESPWGEPRLDVAPNPFTGGTVITYALPLGTGGTEASLALYDLAGRLVRSYRAESGRSGPRRLWLDGRDAHGRPLVSGSYFVRLELPGHVTTRRLTRMR